jgi:S-DNA-T family DNA segregation ATPase FtsK/SpoIIIE
VFDVAIERIVASGGRGAHRVWLPPLGDPPTLDELLARAPGRLGVPVGIVDRPFEQRRDPFIVDLSGAGGHAAVVGATRTGKSTLLRTLIAALALTHTPEQVQFYCLDFGGGGLAALRGLPHVGGVCNRLQPDVVRRTVAEVTALLEEREADFARLGIDSMDAYRRAASRTADVFLVVDGWGTLRSEFDSLETAITKVAARGLAYGVHVIVASNRWAEVRPQLKEQLATRLELRLGEPFESEANRRAAANVPENVPGRGLTRDSFHFLGALPRVDGRCSTGDLAEGVADLVGSVAAGWAGPRAPVVRLLPAALPHADLINAVALQAPAATGTYRRAGEIAFGIAEDDLGPVAADFGAEPHFLVFGDTASGKSNLLRVVADGIVRRHTPAQARLIIVDYRRSLLEAVGDDYLIGYAPSVAVAGQVCKDAAEAMRQRLPAPDVTSAQLRNRSWWHGPDLYLLVDDYDLVAAASGNPLAALLDVLPHSRDIGLHVIVTRASGGAGRAVFEPVLQRLRELGTPGVLLSGSKDEGNLLGNVAAQPMPPGRGNLVHRGQPPRLVQVALLPS